jgi:hypothetical protein
MDSTMKAEIDKLCSRGKDHTATVISTTEIV